MMQLKVAKFGSAMGVVLDASVLDHLRVQEGDTLYATETHDGSLQLSRFTAEQAKQMEIMRAIIKEDREILAAFAR